MHEILLFVSSSRKAVMGWVRVECLPLPNKVYICIFVYCICSYRQSIFNQNHYLKLSSRNKIQKRNKSRTLLTSKGVQISIRINCYTLVQSRATKNFLNRAASGLKQIFKHYILHKAEVLYLFFNFRTRIHSGGLYVKMNRKLRERQDFPVTDTHHIRKVKV